MGLLELADRREDGRLEIIILFLRPLFFFVFGMNSRRLGVICVRWQKSLVEVNCAMDFGVELEHPRRLLLEVSLQLIIRLVGPDGGSYIVSSSHPGIIRLDVYLFCSSTGGATHPAK